MYFLSKNKKKFSFFLRRRFLIENFPYSNPCIFLIAPWPYSMALKSNLLKIQRHGPNLDNSSIAPVAL